MRESDFPFRSRRQESHASLLSILCLTCLAARLLYRFGNRCRRRTALFPGMRRRPSPRWRLRRAFSSPPLHILRRRGCPLPKTAFSGRRRTGGSVHASFANSNATAFVGRARRRMLGAVVKRLPRFPQQSEAGFCGAFRPVQPLTAFTFSLDARGQTSHFPRSVPNGAVRASRSTGSAIPSARTSFFQAYSSRYCSVQRRGESAV